MCSQSQLSGIVTDLCLPTLLQSGRAHLDDSELGRDHSSHAARPERPCISCSYMRTRLTYTVATWGYRTASMREFQDHKPSESGLRLPSRNMPSVRIRGLVGLRHFKNGHRCIRIIGQDRWHSSHERSTLVHCSFIACTSRQSSNGLLRLPTGQLRKQSCIEFASTIGRVGPLGQRAIDVPRNASMKFQELGHSTRSLSVRFHRSHSARREYGCSRHPAKHPHERTNSSITRIYHLNRGQRCEQAKFRRRGLWERRTITVSSALFPVTAPFHTTSSHTLLDTGKP
jgi:hypothetical protein